MLFKNSLQRVVHFTGSGRFSTCSSGQQLVEILLAMREGKKMSDALWAALEARSYSTAQLQADELRGRLLDAHWGGLAWEQVARLQHVRVGFGGQRKGRKLFTSCKPSIELQVPMISQGNKASAHCRL